MKSFKPLFVIAVLGISVLAAVVALAGQAGTQKAAADKSSKPAATATSGAQSATQTPSAEGDKIHWVSYDKGVALQKGTTKHLFVDFTTTWCGWCKKMEAETFSDPAVIQFVNKNFVPVKVWGDQDSILDIDGYKITQQQLTQSFSVSGYPTFWFENPKREKIGPLPGYRSKDDLMSALSFVAECKYDTTKNKQNSAPQNPGK
jgi:thioredoxin-related protein